MGARRDSHDPPPFHSQARLPHFLRDGFDFHRQSHAGRHAAEAQLMQDELVQLLAALDRVEPVSFELVDEADL